MAHTRMGLNLSIHPPGTEGYECWDVTRCRLCSRFRDAATVTTLLLKNEAVLGNAVDLVRWSQQGGRCTLALLLIGHFADELGGLTHLRAGAELVLRWRPGHESNLSYAQIADVEFVLRWGAQEARAVLNACTLTDEPAAHYFVYEYPNTEPVNEAAISKAKRWLGECDAGHDGCTSNAHVDLPKRLVEVTGTTSQDATLRLVETEGLKGCYAALSYVWGDARHQVLTLKSNYDQHLQEIDLDSLPIAIAEAALCALCLGIRYIWIDALCIVQDCIDDRSQGMAAVYKNSYVTLTAASSRSVTERFTDARKHMDNLLGTLVKVTLACPYNAGGMMQWIHDYKAHASWAHQDYRGGIEAAFRETEWASKDAWPDDDYSTAWFSMKPAFPEFAHVFTAPRLADEPISSRAWTLQEALLSPRLLIYGSAQLTWRCEEKHLADGGRVADEQLLPRRVDCKLPLDEASEQRFRHVWRAILHEYTRRSLSDPSDKLSALAGLVQSLGDETGDEYLAGIWRSDVIGGLSWYQDASQHDGAIAINHERTCPSWSWAKTDGPILFSAAAAATTTAAVMRAAVTKNELRGAGPRTTALTVEGSVTLSGRVSRWSPSELLGQFRWLVPGQARLRDAPYVFVDGGRANRELFVGFVEARHTVKCPDALTFLELSRGREDDDVDDGGVDESRGLILTPVPDRDKTYRRLGFFMAPLECHGRMVPGESRRGVDGEPCLTEFGRRWAASLEEDTVTLV